MPYRVEFTASGRKDFKRLDPPMQERIARALARLVLQPRPHGIEQLAKNSYRYRVGDHRIVYEVMDRILVVLVIRVQKRGEVYR